jgi:hypothetical protein
MDENLRKKLRERVFEFAITQVGYDQSRREEITVLSDETGFRIVYGKDKTRGILGFGKTAYLAYNDFIRCWKQVKGHQWLKKNNG